MYVYVTCAVTLVRCLVKDGVVRVNLDSLDCDSYCRHTTVANFYRRNIK